ncbi:MAG TPA: ABC transporter ATP-binding protein [Anaerolineae bacterium]|nr:ABC transporter ATP-binding protein [Anaerolineae bacterium]
MSDIAVRVENLSKRYRIGGPQARYKTLRESLVDMAAAPARRLRRLGQPSPDNETIWALKDVSFEVEHGEVLGIIGRNGSGKTTLLKLLSRITEPTEGYAEIKGRVGSLLEVGTGFHPELTGRENIYLNGAILGMKRAEIDQKFDEIVAFSEIEKFLDTPVKRYSSGMYVRLAFAVAAHLEPEILLVDEVLAVGDAAFQKKCLGKMGDVAKEGRTVLFVSHNQKAISDLCDWAVRLENGQVADQGASADVVRRYLEEQLGTEAVSAGHTTVVPDPSKPMRLRALTVLDHQGRQAGEVEMGQAFRVRIEYDVNRPTTSAHVICFFHTTDGVNVFGSGDADCSPERLGERKVGRYIAEFEVPPFILGAGGYSISVNLSIPFREYLDRHDSVLYFTVRDTSSMRRHSYRQRRPGILGFDLPWTYVNNEPVQHDQ